MYLSTADPLPPTLGKWAPTQLKSLQLQVRGWRAWHTCEWRAWYMACATRGFGVSGVRVCEWRACVTFVLDVREWRAHV